MNLSLKGRSIIVTGAGRSIGRGYALELARRGARVLVNDLGTTVDGNGSDSALAREVAEEICGAGGEAVGSGHNAATREGTAAMVALALDSFGSIDGIVANAGIFKAEIPFDEVEDGLLEKMYAIHNFGPWALAQAAWPYFRKQQRGRIAFVTSDAGLYGMEDNAHYAMVKGGILGLTRALSQDGAKFGVKVNAISPHAYSRMSGLEGESVQAGIQRYKRLSSVDSVVPTVSALMADECPFNGEILSVGSGRIGAVFIGETRGARGDLEGFPAEMILDQADKLFDRTDAVFPRTTTDVVRKLNTVGMD